ncbi:MAG: ATP synthase subunit I [Acidobacteria bacterium]|nr:ATP synthase subunit I [Acidobacteriota bacterium]
MKELNYGAIMRRIVRLGGALALLGCLVSYVAAGVAGLLSFLGGAAISALSFWLLHRLVSDIQAAAEGRQIRGTSVVMHMFRMLILGGAAYAIVNTYGSCRPALAAGLTLAVTAATLEVLIELFYAPH